MTTIRVDSQDLCCNLQEFHCWLTKRDFERLGSKQTGESTEHNIARGWSYVIRRGRTSYRLRRDLQDSEQSNLIQGVLKVKTQRQRVLLEFIHSLLSSWYTACGYGKAADDLHRRRRDSDLQDALFERTDMAAVTQPKDVTEYKVRVSCDRLDVWRFGVCSLKGQNETAAITLHDTDDTTRRAKTIPRNTTRYSNDFLGHCEEVEKQIRRFISHTWRADHECDSDSRVAWTSSQCTVDAEEQTSFLKWTSMDDSGNDGKFAEWSWFRSIAKTPKLEEQRN